MSEFENVTVHKEANVYFEGKVISRTVIFADGSKKTLGVMLPGEYEFNTDQKETMDISSGEVEVLLPEAPDWTRIENGTSFEVPANSAFKIKIHQITNYCCSYID